MKHEHRQGDQVSAGGRIITFHQFSAGVQAIDCGSLFELQPERR